MKKVFQKIRLISGTYFTKKAISLGVFLIIAVNIPVALYLTQQRQNIKQHASTNGSITILDSSTGQQITETTTPDIKLQILLPDNWELKQSTPSSRLNIILKAYAQTASPSATPTTEPTQPAASASATPTSQPNPSATPPLSTTATPSATVAAAAPSPTEIPRHFLTSIIIANEQSGDGDEPRTIIEQDIINALASPIPWQLNSLLSNETSAQRKVQIQFIDSNNVSASTSAEITLKQPSQTSPTATPSATIDILDYFLTKHPTQGLTGKHPLSQSIDGQRAYYMKWQKAGDPTGKSSIFEVYTWDNDYIYLKEDHSGAPVNFYTFTPGKWMKRHMNVGDKITTGTQLDQQENKIQWFDPSCNPTGGSQSFPIEMMLEKHDPAFDAGGNLGIQDIIILKYDSSAGNPDGIFERFYYSREWGWIKWEEYNKANPTTPTNTLTFNQISQTPPLQPLLSAACTPEFRTITSTPPTPTPTLTPTPTQGITCTTGTALPYAGTTSMGVCPGSVPYFQASSLCGNTSHICSLNEFMQTGGKTVTAPLENAWIGNKTAILSTCHSGNLLDAQQGDYAFVTKNTKNYINICDFAYATYVGVADPSSPQAGTLCCSNPPTTPSPTPSINPSLSPTATPIVIPTMTLVPTPTIKPGNTTFTIKVGLQGIGKGGNETPVHPQRAFTITLFDSNGTAVSTNSTALAFNTKTNLFEGQIDMGTPAPGNYTVKAKTDKFLTKVIANILTISTGTTTYTFPTIPTLVAGDLNNDNLLNIEDFNMYKECLGKNTDECIANSDLNNDGETDTVLPVPKFLDYKLLIGNFSLQKGE